MLPSSWEEAYHVFSRDAEQAGNHLVRTLITSPKVKTVLSQKIPQFQPPSQQSRSQFETRTAAINVTPSSGHSYNLDTIKTDTTWLTDEVKLAEEEALRITVLEWQRQPAKVLQSGYSEAELASLRDALGDQAATTSSEVNQVFLKRTDDEFDAVDQRRKRLITIYFKEQAALLGVSRELQELALPKSESANTSDLIALAEQLDHSRSTDNGIGHIADTVDARLRVLEAGRTWSLDADEINDLWLASELLCVRILQEILLLRIRSSTSTVPAQTLLRWLQIMAGCEFFATLQPGPFFAPMHVERLQAMASLTTLAMLDPATTLGSLADISKPTDPNSYFIHADTVNEIHNILFPAAEACLLPAGPPALAWALILSEIKRNAAHAKETRESGAVQRAIDQVASYDSATGRRASTGSLQQSVYEDVIDTLMSTSPVSDPAAYMLRCTIEACHALDMISVLASLPDLQSSLLGALRLQVLQELVSVAVSCIGYTPDILSSQFSILSSPKMASGVDIPDARETFVKNDFLMDSMFAIAAARFPYESLPFLRFCRLLAAAELFDDHGTQYVTFRLKALSSFTQLATGAMASYHTIREDENLNLVALDHPANMLRGSQKRMITYGQDQITSNIIPADTAGEVISESEPPVIRWQHSFSGLSLLGAWLELHYLGQLQSILSPYESADDVVSESIGILTALLKSTLGDLPAIKTEDDRRHQQDEILNDASSSLQTDSDVVDYVFEILEQELQAYRRRPSNVFNTSVLVACIDFVSVLCRVRPNQFWPSFSKSSLLESYGSDSFLLSIVTGVEVPNQNFTFLTACSNLFQSIIQAAKQQSQFGSSRSQGPGVRKAPPQTLRLHANVLLLMTQSLYSAFETIPGWHFASYKQQSQLVSLLASSFEKVITSAHSVGQSTSALTSPFVPASDFLVRQIRLNPDELVSTTSILRHVFRSEELRTYAREDMDIELPLDTLRSLLSLSSILVRLAKLSMQSPSAFERQLFSAIPLFSRNLARSLDHTIIHVLQDLMESLQLNESLSLLSHLGSVSSIAFIEVLKLSIASHNALTLDVAVWDMLARLVGKNQQWLAIVILTGSPPERTKAGDHKPSSSLSLRGKTFMELALSQLTKINELQTTVATAILHFVIQAQQNWSWATRAIEANKDFLPAILSYVCNTFVDASNDLKISHRNKIAALVTDLSTTRLHYAKAMRDTTTLQTITPLLRWLAGNAIDVASYKLSLHTNLRKNFSGKFGGLDLSEFKRTGLTTMPYGENYYYDVDFATELFQHDPNWDRKGKYQDQSFCAEVRRANLNLSVIDSEITLLHGFLGLSVEHCGYFAQDRDLQKTMAVVITNCLDANTQVYPAEKIFEDIFQTRADLAMSLLQRLVESKAKGAEVKALLKSAWECTQSRNGSFSQAIINNDLKYWRSMLTIILLALQFHVDKRYMPPAADASPAALLRHSEQSTSTILEIVTVVVGQGIRSVATALQDQKQVGGLSSDGLTAFISSKDISLILTVFETILRMTRLPEFISEASQRLISENAIQSSLVLYSWSHLLAGPETNDEPIYAGYSLQFLASVSSLPPVAEELAVEGVLTRLLSARVTQKLQAVPDGAGHVDKRPHVQALYNLWAMGILPICVNLLHCVGAPVAAEVSAFLNQFPNQLSRANSAFIPAAQSRSGSSDVVTWTAANEAATLALISFILESFRRAGASAAVDPSGVQPLLGYDEDKKVLAEDISDLVGATTSSLKNRIVATNENEISLAREDNGEGLVKKTVSELRNALTCLRGGVAEDDAV